MNVSFFYCYFVPHNSVTFSLALDHHWKKKGRKEKKNCTRKKKWRRMGEEKENRKLFEWKNNFTWNGVPFCFYVKFFHKVVCCTLNALFIVYCYSMVWYVHKLSAGSLLRNNLYNGPGCAGIFAEMLKSRRIALYRVVDKSSGYCVFYISMS